jgi:CheY-like chemotaxis protein
MAPSTPLSVLLADYHDDTRALYGEYLRRQGCTVEEAADGREALAKAIARRHDIVVSATRLPGIDGYQLCQLLRRDSATSATRVIIVTADAMVADIERARAAGADSTLVKPCLPEKLLAEMQRLLELDRTRSVMRPAPDRADDTGIAADEHAHQRRPILSRVHRRGETTTPSLAPPHLRCPVCDKELVYHHSNIGGVSARHAEQWDYFECSTQCGTFEYRQRTRKIRRVGNAN